MNNKQNDDIIGIKVKGYKFSNPTEFLFWENKNLINLIFGSNAQGKSSICNIVLEAKNEKNNLEINNIYRYERSLIEKYKNDMKVNYDTDYYWSENKPNDDITLELISNKRRKKYSSINQYKHSSFYIFNEKWIDKFKTKINLNEQLFFADKAFSIIFEEINEILLSALYQIEMYFEFDNYFLEKIIDTSYFKKVFSNIHENYCMRKGSYDFNNKNNYRDDDNEHYKIFESLLLLSLDKKYSNFEFDKKGTFYNKIEHLKKEYKLNPSYEKNLEISMFENIESILDLQLNIKIPYFVQHSVPHLDKKIMNLYQVFKKLVIENKKEINIQQHSGIFNTIIELCETKDLIENYKNSAISSLEHSPLALYLFNFFSNELQMKTLFDNICDSLNKLSIFAKKIKNEIIDQLPLTEINEITKFVNDGLLFITKRQNYLKISWNDDDEEKKFYGIVNEKQTNFKNFSTGEKNILSIIWFFGKLWLDIKNYSDKNAEVGIKKNYVIMIDDPLSSFDKDNIEEVSVYITYSIDKTIELTKQKNEEIQKKLTKEKKDNIKKSKIEIKDFVKIYIKNNKKSTDYDENNIEKSLTKYLRNIITEIRKNKKEKMVKNEKCIENLIKNSKIKYESNAATQIDELFEILDVSKIKKWKNINELISDKKIVSIMKKSEFNYKKLIEKNKRDIEEIIEKNNAILSEKNEACIKEITNKFINEWVSYDQNDINNKNAEELRRKIEENIMQIVNNNSNNNNNNNSETISTKFVIFTHDISVYKLLKSSFKNIINPQKDIIVYKELKNNKLINENDTNPLEYNSIIKKLYNFATNNNFETEDYLSIGNNIKRALQFFLYYYRNKSLEEIKSLKIELKEKNTTGIFITNFTNLINYINNKKHVNKNSTNIEFDTIEDHDYYKNLVKQLLCLFYVIDSEHIINHLKKHDNNIKLKIQEWLQKLK